MDFEIDNIEENEHEDNTTVGRQTIDICVPIEVHPFAKVGEITVKCCDDPIVKEDEEDEDKCSFIIKQKICIEVPIEFGAETETGDTFIDCGKASSEDDCEELCKEKDDEDC